MGISKPGRMKLRSIVFSFLLLGLSSALPSPEEGGLRDTLTDLIKTKAAGAFGSLLDCQSSGCLPPFYYCDSRNVLVTKCRFSALTWFLMIGLPLIVIGVVVGVWYYRKKRRESV